MDYISTHNQTGYVTFYPAGVRPPSRSWATVREVTPTMQATLDEARAEGKGVKWEDGELVKVALVTPVPAEIEPAQLREWLIRNGKLAAVNDAIDALPSPQKEIMASWFQFAVKVRRNNPKVAAIAQALQMSGEDVDNAFREASKY